MPFDRHRAKAFVDRWQKASGDEEREFRSYVIELMSDVLGIDSPTRLVDFERSVKRRRIDAFWEDQGILIEGKSRGVDLDKPRDNGPYGMETPYQQARWYYANMQRSVAPRWLLVSNFDTWRVYDLDQEDPEASMVEVSLEELATPAGAEVLGMFLDRSQSRIVKEQELSVAAGEVVGKLYDAFAEEYRNLDTDPEEQRSLNVLIVRLVFLLYAEDAGLMPSHQAVYKWLNRFGAQDFRNALKRLFKVLDTPEDERDPYMDPELAVFPYVNGSLFSDESIVIPQVSDALRFTLLEEASRAFDWAKISPTIFGAVFESTLNPETRRAGGMHYTSIENIHRVIDPLFLDGLKAELSEIEALKTERARKARFRAFQDKLAALEFLDPACGSGNFLTETYISLRRLENRAIDGIQEGQAAMLMDNEESPVKVSITQMHGIEVNDFAVSVAKTALWIAEAQMLDETQEILYSGGSNAVLDFLPLTTNAEIRKGNALLMDWDEVLPSDECSYVMGNPPFFGAKFMSRSQKKEITDLFAGVRLANSLDYVSGWFLKAAEYMQGTTIHCAFVSTNSITQGQQVFPLWDTLVKRFGVVIDFAWQAFIWESEVAARASVHCVIVGFSVCGTTDPVIFEGDAAVHARTINPYLLPAPWVPIPNRSRPLCDVPAMALGNSAYDDGAYVLTDDEKDELLRVEPGAEQFLRRYIGGDDFINGTPRWVIWLEGATPREIDALPEISRRVEHVRQFRLNSTAADTRRKAATPHLFFRISQPKGTYLAVPLNSSERRTYLPIGYLPPEVIVAKTVSFVPDADLYTFGVMCSSVHNGWMRTVAGRLEVSYRYSNKIVYNNFVWPSPTPGQRAAIESLAQAVLDAREAHGDRNLAQLYDPDLMPADLLGAHQALDAAVLEAYGLHVDATEEEVVAHLFQLYAELTA